MTGRRSAVRSGPRIPTGAALVRRTAAATAAGILLLAGCGIRTTSVPVDAGAAPSRSVCVPSTEPLPRVIDRSPSPSGALRMDWKVLYMVCNAQIDRVIRPGKLRGTRLEVARALLAELRRKPRAEEKSTGYGTAVPSSIKVTAALPGDPERTLRLNLPLDDLPPFALGQIVCTLSSVVADGGPIRLGDPTDDPVREFTCDTQLRTEPEVGMEAGTPV